MRKIYYFRKSPLPASLLIAAAVFSCFFFFSQNKILAACIVTFVILIIEFCLFCAIIFHGKENLKPIAKRLFALTAVAVLALVRGLLSYYISDAPAKALNGQSLTFSGRVSGLYMSYPKIALESAGGEKTCVEFLALNFRYNSVRIGDRVEGVATFSYIEELDSAEEELQENVLRSNDILAAGKVEEGYTVIKDSSFYLPRAVEKLRTAIVKKLSGMEQQGIAAAVLCQDKSSLQEDIRAAFQNTGLGHMLAVSGLHVSVLLSTLCLILRALRLKKNQITLILLPTSLIYIGVANFTPSVMRAVFMTSLSLIAFFHREKGDAISSLCFSGVILMFLSPNIIGNTSFLLSFFATLGILSLGSPIIAKLREYLVSRPQNAPVKTLLRFTAETVLGSFIISASALIFTFPIISQMSGGLNLATIPLTFIILPVFEAAFIFLLPGLLLSFIYKPLSYPLFRTADGLFDLMSKIVKKCGKKDLSISMPDWVAPVLLVLIIAFLLFLSIKKQKVWPRLLLILMSASLFLGGTYEGRGSFDRSEIFAADTDDEGFLLVSNGTETSLFIGNIQEEDELSLLEKGMKEINRKRLDYCVLSFLSFKNDRLLNLLSENYEIGEVIIPLSEPELGSTYLDYLNFKLDKLNINHSTLMYEETFIDCATPFCCYRSDTAIYYFITIEKTRFLYARANRSASLLGLPPGQTMPDKILLTGGMWNCDLSVFGNSAVIKDIKYTNFIAITVKGDEIKIKR